MYVDLMAAYNKPGQPSNTTGQAKRSPILRSIVGEGMQSWSQFHSQLTGDITH